MILALMLFVIDIKLSLIIIIKWLLKKGFATQVMAESCPAVHL